MEAKMRKILDISIGDLVRHKSNLGLGIGIVLEARTDIHLGAYKCHWANAPQCDAFIHAPSLVKIKRT